MKAKLIKHIYVMEEDSEEPPERAVSKVCKVLGKFDAAPFPGMFIALGDELEVIAAVGYVPALYAASAQQGNFYEILLNAVIVNPDKYEEALASLVEDGWKPIEDVRIDFETAITWSEDEDEDEHKCSDGDASWDSDGLDGWLPGFDIK